MGTSIRWSSRTAFIFATAAAAVGLGNIWRFPYLTGQNGGSAFVLIYLFCVIALGIPLMLSEMILGRLGRKNPLGAIQQVAQETGRSRHWKLLGGLTILAGFLILSYYLVISGWVLDYTAQALFGLFKPSTESNLAEAFSQLQNSPWRMLLSDTLIALATIGILLLGLKKGLERAVLFLFPALILLLLILLAYAATTPAFHEGVAFLLKPDFHQITAKVVLLALGQAFFSLNISMGVVMMFSAYLPKATSIPKSVVAVAIADTGIALLAGLIIFPIAFSNQLPATAGPSLIFQTLPLAFGKMPWGGTAAILFFLLLLFAAFTSSIALLEPTIAWLAEQYAFSRKHATWLSGSVCWILSLGTLFSFSHREVMPFLHITFYQGLDFITSAIMLPLGGLLIAIFAGWLLPLSVIQTKLEWQTSAAWFKCWRAITRYFAPVAIVLILLTSLGIF